eukprot:5005775-Amphidinium_carterae.1
MDCFCCHSYEPMVKCRSECLSRSTHCRSRASCEMGRVAQYVYGRAQLLPPVVEFLEGHMPNGLAAAVPDWLSNEQLRA